METVKVERLEPAGSIPRWYFWYALTPSLFLSALIFSSGDAIGSQLSSIS